MTADRPEELYPLFRDIDSLKGIGKATRVALDRMGVRLVRDLIYLFPKDIIVRNRVATINEVDPPAFATLSVEVGRHFRPAVTGPPYRIEVHDEQTSFMLVFFRSRHDQLEQQFPTGSIRVVSGKLELFDDNAQMVHPDYIVIPQREHEIPLKEPVYALTEGISNKAMQRFMALALQTVPELAEWHDPDLVAGEAWPSWRSALFTVHSSDKNCTDDLRSLARERLCFDELAANQISLFASRHRLKNSPAAAADQTGELRELVLLEFGNQLTAGQGRVLDEILSDMARPERMIRLLQGDVGSGKTIVAILALVAAVEAGGQATMMLPTEILARQQFSLCLSLLKGTSVTVDIMTGRDDPERRDKVRASLRSGSVDILIGTQSLIQKNVEFKHLSLAVIDEQHRFGVAQRRMLLQCNPASNLLMMTATPIPRSLALVNYGEADLSILAEKPAGRAGTRTAAIPVGRIRDVVDRLRIAVKEGRQAYWICPVVEEAADDRHLSAEQRARTLSRVFGGQVDFVHGQMQHEHRMDVMDRFLRGQVRILVATTVVEVGMDVPNASIMVIESAERFGLAQLHQLRGRVGRGEHESACVLIYNPPLTDMAKERLSIIRKTTDGFEIADADLDMRGAGDLAGLRQSGETRFLCADPHAQRDSLEKARNNARSLVHGDPELAREQGLATRNLLYLFGQDQILTSVSI